MNLLWPLLPAVIGTAFLAMVFRPKKKETPINPEPTVTNDDITALRNVIKTVRTIVSRPARSEQKVSEISSVLSKIEEEEREHASR